MSACSARDSNYICINCGNLVGELFKEYSPSVLKMSNCGNCHKIADKYVEYDPVIVIIDVVLLNREAYRHILYNTCFKNHWKLAIILLLVEAYYNWSRVHQDSTARNARDIHYDLFQGEENFYLLFGKSVFEMLVVYCTLYVITYLIWASDPYRQPKGISFDTLCKSLVLSNCGTFMLVLHMIWGISATVDPMVFVVTYIFFSQVQALSVVCHSSRTVAVIGASATLAMRIFSKSLMSSTF